MSEFAGLDPKGSKWAPGMTQPIVAGEEYILNDVNNEKLILQGRDDPRTIEAFVALDNYFAVRGALPADALPCKAAWQAVLDKFDALPKRIKDQLPSAKMGGVVLNGHGRPD